MHGDREADGIGDGGIQFRTGKRGHVFVEREADGKGSSEGAGHPGALRSQPARVGRARGREPRSTCRPRPPTACLTSLGAGGTSCGRDPAATGSGRPPWRSAGGQAIRRSRRACGSRSSAWRRRRARRRSSGSATRPAGGLLILDRIESTQRLRVALDVGHVVRPPCRSGLEGAARPPRAARDRARRHRPLPQVGPATITDRDVLLRDLEGVGGLGHARSCEEVDRGRMGRRIARPRRRRPGAGGDGYHRSRGPTQPPRPRRPRSSAVSRAVAEAG